jgi:hypothetical protein
MKRGPRNDFVHELNKHRPFIRKRITFLEVENRVAPDMGQTFLALHMKRSNTHSQPVIIKSIELHPGVSVLFYSIPTQ